MSIISAKDFTLYYGSKIGVEQITMDVKANSVTAIIGPSGCGKSTFLRSINRMNDHIPDVHTEGSLCVEGEKIYDKRLYNVPLRRVVGKYLFQHQHCCRQWQGE